jgi:hypothetical protein
MNQFCFNPLEDRAPNHYNYQMGQSPPPTPPPHNNPLQMHSWSAQTTI